MMSKRLSKLTCNSSTKFNIGASKTDLPIRVNRYSVLNFYNVLYGSGLSYHVLYFGNASTILLGYCFRPKFF